MYYRWSKVFLDVGKNGLTRDTTTDEVRALEEENATMKKSLAESVLVTSLGRAAKDPPPSTKTTSPSTRNWNSPDNRPGGKIREDRRERTGEKRG